MHVDIETQKAKATRVLFYQIGGNKEKKSPKWEKLIQKRRTFPKSSNRVDEKTLYDDFSYLWLT